MSDAPILHIVDATLAALAQQADKPQRVGIIATQGTLEAGWYQRKLAAQGVEVVEPTQEELARWFVPGCYAVKRGALEEGASCWRASQRAVCTRRAKADSGLHRGPRCACGGESAVYDLTFDPARALAERCSQLWQAR